MSAVVAIVQARMGSVRLPKKVLKEIAGIPMIYRVIERVNSARLISRTIVATTTLPEDDELVEYLEGIKICDIFRGSPDDVLNRYFECAKKYAADIVVRVTADDPLKDPEIIDRAIQIILENNQIDYCSNTISPSFPEGLDIEVFRMNALEIANSNAMEPSEREHVTPYIWKNEKKFKLLNFSHEVNLSAWRWTVDRPEDIIFMNCIFHNFNDYPLVSFRDVISFINKNIEISYINSGIMRNEGYIKSVEIQKRKIND